MIGREEQIAQTLITNLPMKENKYSLDVVDVKIQVSDLI